MKMKRFASFFLAMIMLVGMIPMACVQGRESAVVNIDVQSPSASAEDPMVIDLSQGEYADWAHFGHTTADAVNRKADGEGLIGTPSAIQGSALSAASESDVKNYRMEFTWSDGTPTSSAASRYFVKKSGGQANIGGTGIRMDFNLPAGDWDLVLYASTYNTIANVEVRDQDGNLLQKAALSEGGQSWVHLPKEITIGYSSETAQKISVDLVGVSNYADWPGIALAAATVEAGQPRDYIVSTTSTKGGSVTGDGQFKKGDQVTLTATPEDGYIFKEWQVVKGNVQLSDKTANPITFTMPSGDVTMRAVFTDPSGQQQEDLIQYINMNIGSTSGYSNTIIGPQRPNASVNPSPDTNPQNSCTGYNADGEIRGFSQIHVSGTGVGKYGQFLVSPQVGLSTRLDGHDSAKENENPTCSEYSVTLADYDIDCSFTPAEHSTIYKFAYPESDNANLVIDLAHNIANGNAKDVKADISTDGEGNTVISGSGRYVGGWGPEHDLYFYAVVNKTPKVTGTYDASGPKPGVNSLGPVDITDRLAGLGAYLTFDTQADEEILLKMGVSFKSIDQAKTWLDSEIPQWDYDAVKAETEDQWNEELNKIVIDGDISEEDKQIFYTSIYHAHVMPRDRTGDIAKYGDADMMDDHFATWDTWRTLYPLYTITNPDLVAKTINSYITRQKVNGYVRDSIVGGNDMMGQQGGDDVDNVIVDAYLKGIEGVDWEEAYEVIKKNATDYRLDYQGWGIANPGDSNYKSLGWIPSDNTITRIMSCSYQLEYAYNDYLAAQMAKGLGDMDNYEKWLERSNSWTNIWNEDIVNNGYTGFIWPKAADGSWVYDDELIPDPTKKHGSWVEFFYEASSWDYSFFVPHDIPQLIEKMGGEDTFCDRLKLGLDRNWVDIGNEPAFLSAYLFNYTSKPYLTTDYVGKLRDRFSINGKPGNDDSGAMSSWYIFSSIGFFPNAGQNLYYFTSPYYEKTTITMDNGNQFIIRANNLSEENKYIQSITLNGKPYKSTMFKHEDIVNGGELVFEMGNTPVDYTKEASVTINAIDPVEEETVVDLDSAVYSEWAQFSATDKINRRISGESPILASDGLQNVGGYWTQETLSGNAPGFSWTNGSPDASAENNQNIVWSQQGVTFDLNMPGGSYDVELYATGIRSRSIIEVLGGDGDVLVQQELLPNSEERQYRKVSMRFELQVLEKCTIRLLTDPNDQSSDFSVGIAAATLRTIDSYNVVFDSAGGTNVPAQSVKEGEKVQKPADPIREGYRFLGWYRDAEGSQAFDFEQDTIANDLTLYAKWIAVYDVAFSVNGGSAIASQQVEDGSFVERPTDPTRFGYTFEGWYKDVELTMPWDVASDVVNQDVTLYACWKPLPTATISSVEDIPEGTAVHLSDFDDWTQYGLNQPNEIATNRKDNMDPIIGQIASVDNAYSTGENNPNQPVSFTWNDGVPTSSETQGSTSFGWSSKGLDIPLTLPTGAYQVELYATGIRANATIAVLDQSGEIVVQQPLWENTGEQRQYQKVTLDFFCTEGESFTVRLLVGDDKQSANYSVGLSAVAVKRQAPGVTVLTEGPGSVTGAGIYEEGSTVTLTATPEEGYQLQRWEVVKGSLELEGKAVSPLTFAMPSDSLVIRAVFEEQTVSILGVEKVEEKSTINLSDEKYSDWAYLGYKDKMIYKADRQNAIFAGAASAVSGSLTEEQMDKYNPNSPYFNWQGGTPTETGENVRYIVWNNTGIAFDMNLPAGQHNASFYISGVRAGAYVQVADESGAVVLEEPLWSNPGGARVYRKLNLSFDCDEAQKYTIRLMVDQNDHEDANYSVSLFAAVVESVDTQPESDLSFTDGEGNPLTALTADTLVTTLQYQNTSPEDQSRMLVVAVYNADGRMMYSGQAIKDIAAGQKDTLQVTLTMPDNADGHFAKEGYYAHVFLWDGNTFQPVCEKVEFGKDDGTKPMAQEDVPFRQSQPVPALAGWQQDKWWRISHKTVTSDCSAYAVYSARWNGDLI